MGLSPLSGGRDSSPSPPNPDPSRFELIRCEAWGPWVIAAVRYHGCTTFEGRKVLVLEMPVEELRALARLDPHFREGGPLVARFEPTERGWAWARDFCRGTFAEVRGDDRLNTTPSRSGVDAPQHRGYISPI